jgi:SAM-dependent methyltransferase
MNWTAGYVADIGYSADFFAETAPAHLAFAALSIGRSPGHALRPNRVLELGCGQGFGLALLASANPDVTFEGYDFNPEHVAHARRLIEGANLTNISVTETSFEDAAAHGGDNNLDVITLHGIFSWVGRPVQNAILAIIRQRLRPDGLAYISYNCMPGWAPLIPIRQLMMDVKRRNPGRSDQQVDLALKLLADLRRGNAAYFAANPAAARHLDGLLKSPRQYLAHEYFNEQWQLLRFSEMVDRANEAKLSFLASATLAENLDRFSAVSELLPFLNQINDFVFKETLRDFTANKRFRRDIYKRGSSSLTAKESRRLFSEVSFALCAPRNAVKFEFAGPLGRLDGKAELYKPIVEVLTEKIAGFEELVQLPPFGKENMALLLECLVLLVHSGQVLPIVAPQPKGDSAQRFNSMIIDHARNGRFYYDVASPVARTGIRVTDFGLLTLAALSDGKDTVQAAARYAMAILKEFGGRPRRDGVPITDDSDAANFVTENVETIMTDYVPVWQRLSVL